MEKSREYCKAIEEMVLRETGESVRCVAPHAWLPEFVDDNGIIIGEKRIIAAGINKYDVKDRNTKLSIRIDNYLEHIGIRAV